MFYHIYSTAMSLVDPTDDCYESAKKTWLCPGCCRPRLSFQSIDVALEGKMVSSPLSVVNGMGIGVVRVELLECLGPEVLSLLALGRVLNLDGTENTSLRTFRGRHQVYVRGNKNSTFQRCSICGRRLYYPMGKRYLTEPLPLGVGVAESQFKQLVITEPLFKRVMSRRWKKLGTDALPIQPSEDALQEEMDPSTNSPSSQPVDSPKQPEKK